MSITSEITRIKNGIASAYSKIDEMGGDLPQTQNLDNLVNSIGGIPSENINDYFETTPESITTSEESPWGSNFVKKTPDLTIPAGTTSLQSLFQYYSGALPKVINDSDVTNMQYMYAGAKGQYPLDCSGLNTTNVYYLNYMFADREASSIDATGLGTIDTSNISGLFQNCKYATRIDLSNFDISSYVDASYMFNNTKKLAVLDVSKLTFTRMSYKNYIFVGCGTQCLQSDGAYADGIPYVYVKNVEQQQWILNQGSNIPSSWSTNNVVIKS